MTSPWSPPGTGEPPPDASSPLRGTTDGHPPRAGRGAPGRELATSVPLFPLRPLGLGEVLGAATGIYRLRPRVVLAASGAVFSVVFVLSSIASGASLIPFFSAMQGTVASTGTGSPATAGTDPSSLGALVLGSLVSGLLSTIAVQLVTLAVAPLAVAEASRQVLPDRTVWATLRHRGPAAALLGLVLALLGSVAFLVVAGLGALPLLLVGHATIATVLSLAVALVLGALAALWVHARLCLATAALAVEGLGPLAATRRSLALTRGRRVWRVLGIELLLQEIGYVATQVVGGALSLVGLIVYAAILLASNGHQLVLAGTVLTILTFLGVYLASFLIQPFLSAGTTALYADQRIRHESWDIDLARTARTGQGRGGAPIGEAP